MIYRSRDSKVGSVYVNNFMITHGLGIYYKYFQQPDLKHMWGNVDETLSNALTGHKCIILQ